MRRLQFLASTCALFATWILGVAPAFAEPSTDSATAQGLFDEAKALMAAGRAVEACPKLEESQRLDPGVGTLLNLAKCYEESGRIASAWSAYLEAAAGAKTVGNAEREHAARQLAAGLAPRVSKLAVKVLPESRISGLEVLRDGVVVGPAQWGLALPTNAGEHRILARAPGHREWSSVVQVRGEGTLSEIAVPKLDVAAVAAGPQARGVPEEDAGASGSGLGTQKVLALVSGSVGAAGLAVGTVLGLRAMSKKSDAEDACSGRACTTDAGVTAGNDAHTAGNLATLGMVVGAVFVTGGLVLWFTAKEEAPPVQAGFGLGSVQVRGAW